MLITIFLPLLSFLGLICFGRFLGKLGTLYWITVNCFVSICLNIYLFYCINTYSTAYYLSFGSWITVEFFDIQWEFVIDSIAMIMLLMVSLISSLVHFYSMDYMKTDPHFIRFMSFLSLFTFFMYLLVTSTNFIQLFFGWEGVGICSYLLINFWTTRLQAGKAAIKAVLMNRIGDIGYLIGVSLLYSAYFSLDFSILYTVLGVDPMGSDLFIFDAVCFFFLLGVIAKSAQVGLHTWLPAAMEGPTPVSALIHAATMVTAGIFLVIRTSFLFELSPLTCQLAVCFGVITAFLSAITAVFLYDIKRIIAYSTCSQLGYMLVAAGLSQYNLSLFHLINHAFFKALLFLTAGAIIHSCANEQDIRKLGLLYQRAPLLFSSLFIGNIAIMGLPFLAGFYSKDLILESAFLRLTVLFNESVSSGVLVLLWAATALTAVYSCRLVYYTIFKTRQYQFDNNAILHFSQPLFIQVALISLCIFSIFSGYVFSDFFNATNLSVLPSVYWLPWMDSLIFEFEFLLPLQKLVPIILNTCVIFFFILIITFLNNKEKVQARSVGFALNISYFSGEVKNFTDYLFYCYYTVRYSSLFLVVAKLISQNFYFNEVYNFFAVFQFSVFYPTVFLNFDKGVVELFGPSGVSRIYSRCVLRTNRIFKAEFKTYLFSLYTILVLYYFLFLFFIS